MIETLRGDIRGGRFGHAYLIFGDTAAAEAEAYEFAAALHCETPVDGMACGSCRRCRQRQAGQFAELVTLEPEKKTYLKKQISEMLKYTALTGGETRVFWLKKADALGEICSDSLLKTLEEPAANTVFLLTAENDDRVAETILSRCRVIRLPRNGAAAADEEDVLRAFRLGRTGSYAAILKLAETFAAGKSREDIAAFFETAAAILGGSYAFRRGAKEPKTLLPSAEWSEDALFEGWRFAVNAPVLLDHAIQHRLILENFLLTLKRS
ncbi:MAG: hypothetical protein ACOX8R_10900 [Bacillota bacterium]|jgi:hypothetical protein